MSFLLELSITPMDKGESMGKYVAKNIEIIHQSGLNYKLGPMGTSIEGEYDEVMKVVKQCFEKTRQDCRRISIAIKADYRAGAKDRLKGKIESVEKHLGHSVKK